MDSILNTVNAVNKVLWDYILLFLLCGTGIYFTVRLKFIQVRKFGEGFRRLFGGLRLNGKKAGAEGMSSFQALTTAVAAQVGTGNIAGAATAIVSGGPGAIFWMWVSAFFGMATIFGEAVLAQKYKTTLDGEVTGGPIYYIRAAFRGRLGRFLAVFFSIAVILALGFMGNMVQSNSIGVAMESAFGIPAVAAGIAVAVVAGFIFLGGVAGITVQKAMRFGVARGLFSNEAGMGSTPHAHAIAKVERPRDQGVMAMMGVFIDTFVILTLTALVILSSGALSSGKTGTELAQAAFHASFGYAGDVFIAVCILFFAFSTIIGWYFFGQSNVKALFGKKAIKVYALLVVLFVIVGSAQQVDLVWNLSDLFNGLMVIPNLLGLLALSGLVVKLAKDRADGLPGSSRK